MRTGLSGSGKSSLAFDTLYAEGQRRYVESLSAYARQFLERMEKPDVDEIDGIAPPIAIRQKNTTRNGQLHSALAALEKWLCNQIDAGVDIAPDGKSVWAVDRCGSNTCVGCEGRVEQSPRESHTRSMEAPSRPRRSSRSDSSSGSAER